jgi:hypothetical protein
MFFSNKPSYGMSPTISKKVGRSTKDNANSRATEHQSFQVQELASHKSLQKKIFLLSLLSLKHGRSEILVSSSFQLQINLAKPHPFSNGPNYHLPPCCPNSLENKKPAIYKLCGENKISHNPDSKQTPDFGNMLS